MKKITIETMKDLKVALSKVPNEVLEYWAVGGCEEGIFGCSDGGDDGDEAKMIQNYKKYMKKYPALKKIEAYFEAVVKMDEEGCDVISI